MPALTRSTGEATLTAGTVSQIVQCTNIDKVAVTIVGDADTGTLTIKQRLTPGGTWYVYSPGGVDQTFDTDTLDDAAATHNEVYEVGGCDLRFDLATGGELTVYVTGVGTHIKDEVE